jgi:uncharacterized protein YegP (UPF0339 family)
MPGWFELTKSEKDQYKFVLKAANGEVVLRSETYTSKAAAQNGIASVQKNSPDAARYEKKDAKNGQFFFNLKAANHQVIGTSQMYDTAAARDKGIASVTKNGPTTTIKEPT